MSNTNEASKASVFTGAAVPYAAFNLRDPYYREMAQLVVDAAVNESNHCINALELGCGIGISTMILAKKAENVVAVEPDESMRMMAALHFAGNRRVKVVEGRAEALSRDHVPLEHFDFACACQMVHLLNPPSGESHLTKAFGEIANSLKRGGVFAFDLGPSNYEFAMPIRDHRSECSPSGSIPTEFCHYLYRQMEPAIRLAVRSRFSDMDLPASLWPAATARMTEAQIKDVAWSAGFHDVKVEEVLLPLTTERILNFIRNGWAVFFRWGKLSELPAKTKLEIVADAMELLVGTKQHQTVYHPSAVFTLIK